MKAVCPCLLGGFLEPIKPATAAGGWLRPVQGSDSQTTDLLSILLCLRQAVISVFTAIS